MQELLHQFRLEAVDGSPKLRVTRAVFVRSLGLVHVIAFLGLWVQIIGLVGSDGILPAPEIARGLDTMIGWERHVLVPSLFWLWPTDAMLHLLCGGGVLLGVVVMAGFVQGPALLGLWALYLSLHTIAQPFLGFQWDALLLEVTFLALLVAPWRLRSVGAPEPAPAAMTLVRFLHLRVLFFSGLGKVLGGSSHWTDLNATAYHTWTQPLPTPVSWALWRLPDVVHLGATSLVIALELVPPLLFLFGRIPRTVAFASTIALMAIVDASGNQGFMPLLVAVIAISLLDDRVTERILGPAVSRFLVGSGRVAHPAEKTTSAPDDSPPVPEGGSPLNWRREARFFLVGAVATLLFLTSIFRTWVTLAEDIEAVPTWSQRLITRLHPFRVVNSYGMVTAVADIRQEVILEGTVDGVNWLPYELPYKPGDPTVRPRFAWFHVPRLDWQLKDATWRTCLENGWIVRIQHQLAEGSPAVESLFATVPFGEDPPLQVRAMRYDYRFAAPGTPGLWWDREELGLYCPAVSRLGEPVEI